MARTSTPKETKATAAKPTKKEIEFKSIRKVLSEVFDDLRKDEIDTLTKMNQIENPYEKGQAIEYFWAAKRVNG